MRGLRCRDALDSGASLSSGEDLLDTLLLAVLDGLDAPVPQLAVKCRLQGAPIFPDLRRERVCWNALKVPGQKGMVQRPFGCHPVGRVRVQEHQQELHTFPMKRV